MTNPSKPIEFGEPIEFTKPNTPKVKLGEPVEFTKPIEFGEPIEFVAPPSIPSEFGKSFMRSTAGMVSMADALVGLGAQLAGKPNTAAKFLESAARTERAAAANYPEAVPEWKKATTPRRKASYLASLAGTAGPSLIESLAVGLLGATVGSAVAPGPGTAAGGAGGLIAGGAKGLFRKALEKYARRGIVKKGLALTPDVLKAEMKASSGKLGSALFQLFNSYGLSTGEIYNSLASDPDIDPDTAVNYSLGFGGLAAIPDTFLPSYVINKSGVIEKIAGATKDTTANVKRGFYGYLTRMLSSRPDQPFLLRWAKEMPKAMPLEGGTEGFQEIVNIAAEKYAKKEPFELSDKDLGRVKKAAAVGAMAGFLASPIAAVSTEGGAPGPQPQTGNLQVPLPPPGSPIVAPPTAPQPQVPPAAVPPLPPPPVQGVPPVAPPTPTPSTPAVAPVPPAPPVAPTVLPTVQPPPVTTPPTPTQAIANPTPPPPRPAIITPELDTVALAIATGQKLTLAQENAVRLVMANQVEFEAFNDRVNDLIAWSAAQPAAPVATAPPAPAVPQPPPPPTTPPVQAPPSTPSAPAVPVPPVAATTPPPLPIDDQSQAVPPIIPTVPTPQPKTKKGRPSKLKSIAPPTPPPVAVAAPPTSPTPVVQSAQPATKQPPLAKTVLDMIAQVRAEMFGQGNSPIQTVSFTTQPLGFGFVVNIDDPSELIINIDELRQSQAVLKKRFAGGLKAVISEELIHSIDVLIQQAEWKQQGRPTKTFLEFWEQQGKLVWDQLTAKQQAFIKSIYGDGKSDGYYGNEYVRLVQQRRHAGMFTEQFTRQINAKLGKIAANPIVQSRLGKLIEALRNVLKYVLGKGDANVGEFLAKRIESIDGYLKETTDEQGRTLQLDQAKPAGKRKGVRVSAKGNEPAPARKGNELDQARNHVVTVTETDASGKTVTRETHPFAEWEASLHEKLRPIVVSALKQWAPPGQSESSVAIEEVINRLLANRLPNWAAYYNETKKTAWNPSDISREVIDWVRSSQGKLATQSTSINQPTTIEGEESTKEVAPPIQPIQGTNSLSDEIDNLLKETIPNLKLAPEILAVLMRFKDNERGKGKAFKELADKHGLSNETFRLMTKEVMAALRDAILNSPRGVEILKVAAEGGIIPESAVPKPPNAQAAAAATSGEANHNLTLAQTAQAKATEALTLLVQSVDVLGFLNKHGLQNLSGAAARTLRGKDLAGIQNQATMQLGLNAPQGYRDVKQQVAGDPIRTSWVTRLAAVHFARVTKDLTDVVQRFTSIGPKLVASIAKIGAQINVAQQQVDVLKAAEDQFKATLNSAIIQAKQAFRQEVKTDRDLAGLEAQTKLLENMLSGRKALTDMVADVAAVLSKTPLGMHLIADPQSVNRTQILTAYLADGNGRYTEARRRTELRLAIYVLSKQAHLADQLLALQYIKQQGVAANLNAFTAQFFAGLKQNPVTTVNNLMRNYRNLVNAQAKAKFVFMTLNRNARNLIRKYYDMATAKDVAMNVLNDPEFKSLRREVFDDAQVLSLNVEPAKIQAESSSASNAYTAVIGLPDGTVLPVGSWPNDPAKFQAVRDGLESAISKLESWLAQNLEHPDYPMHYANLEFIKNNLAVSDTYSPMDSQRLKRWNLDMLWNVVNSIGGRSGDLLKTFTKALEETNLAASWLREVGTTKHTKAFVKAAKSHGFNVRDDNLVAIADLYDRWVLNPLAASWQLQDAGYQVGDTLITGEQVTQEDLDFLKLQADIVTELFDRLPNQVTKDTIDVPFFRKAMKAGDFMVVRRFNFDAATFTQAFTDLFKAWRNPQASPAALASASNGMLALMDQYFDEHVLAFIEQRNPDFAMVTPFDGDGRMGIFKLIADNIKAGVYPNVRNLNMAWLIGEMANMSGMPADDVTKVLLNEFGRLVSNIDREIRPPPGVTVSSDEAKNMFTRSRNKLLAPSSFYVVGFPNSDTLMQFYSQASSLPMEQLLGAINIAIQELKAEKESYRKATEDLRKRGEKKPEKKALNANQEALRNGQTYSDWRELDYKINQLEKLKVNLTKDLYDVQYNTPTRRAGGVMVQAKLAGSGSTIRNVSSGPIYLGWAMRQLTGSMFAYPEAFVRGIYAQARVLYPLLKRLGFSFTKLPYGASMAAINAIKDPTQRNAYAAFHTTIRYGLEEFGRKLWDDMPTLRKMVQEGVDFVPDFVEEVDARLMLGGNSMLYQGLIPGSDYSSGQKAVLKPLSYFETLLQVFVRPLHPFLGDKVLNEVAYNMTLSSMGPIQKLEKQLRKLFDHYVAGGRQFDFNNPRSSVNALSAREVMPTFWNRTGSRLLPADNTSYVQLVQFFRRAGLRFQEEAVNFIKELDGGNPNAHFLTPEKRRQLAKAVIEYVNMPTIANRPFWTRTAHVLNQLFAPFMGWRIAMLGNFTTALNIASKDPDVKRMTAWMMAATATVLPTLIFHALMDVGSEDEDRLLKRIMYHMIKAVRRPTESQTTSKAVESWVTHAINPIPILDTVFNILFTQFISRGRYKADPVTIQTAKDIGEYLGGVIQTGDITYGLTRFLASMLPESQVVLNRMKFYRGTREITNATNLLRRFGPDEFLKPIGKGQGQDVNPLSPYGDRMVNAAMVGDFYELALANQQAKLEAAKLKRSNPEQVALQLYSSRDPWRKAFNAMLTEEQKQSVLSAMSAQDRSYFLDAYARYTQGLLALGGGKSNDQSFPVPAPAGNNSGGYGLRGRRQSNQLRSLRQN